MKNNKYTIIYLIVGGIGLLALLLLEFAKVASLRIMGDTSFFYVSQLTNNTLWIMPVLLVIDILWAIGRKKYLSILTFINMMVGVGFFVAVIYLAANDNVLVYDPGLGLVVVEICFVAMMVIAFIGRRERKKITNKSSILEEGK